MKKRLDSMERILDVQRQLRRIAEAKLGELERREARLQATRHQLVDALNGDNPLHGLFVDAMARRVKSVSREINSLGRAKEAQSKRLLEQTGKMKRAERAAASLDREYQAALEKRDLAELIDRMKPREE